MHVADFAAQDVGRVEKQGGADALALELGGVLEELGDKGVLVSQFALEGVLEPVDFRLDGFVDALQRCRGLTQDSSFALGVGARV